MFEGLSSVVFSSSSPLLTWHAAEKVALPAGPIEGPKQVAPDSLNLPEGFQWVTLDVDHEPTVRWCIFV